MSSPQPALAGWRAPLCLCGHLLTRHRAMLDGGCPCTVDGCGCTEFRARDDDQHKQEAA